MRLIVLLLALFFCSLQIVDAAAVSSTTVNIPEQGFLPDNKPAPAKAQYYISLIIDDMGYRYQSGKRAINLPANITYAFLPYAPHARKLANLANKKQKEIMLHIPMEATSGKKLGPGGLTAAMPRAVFELELQHNLLAIPYIKGVNNHMGSLLTQQSEPMTWLMEMLVTREMYFVDSRTSGKSQALNVARQYGLRSETRDVFVDNDLSEKAIQQQLALAMSVARRSGSAVVIAHPFPETIRALEQWLPEAKAQGLEFVYMSELLSIRQKNRAQLKINKRVTQWQTPLKQNKNN